MNDIQSVALPVALVAVLPVVVTVVSGWLTAGHFPQWLNALLIALVVAGMSVAAMFLSGSFSGGPFDVTKTFMLFAGFTAALISSPILRPLLIKLLVSVPSPLGFLVKPKPALGVLAPSGSKVSQAAPVPLPTPVTPETGDYGPPVLRVVKPDGSP